MQENIFIGPMGGGGIPKDGASIKNYHICRYLEKYKLNPILIDTAKWRKNPFILLKLFCYIIRYPKAIYLISISQGSAYKLIKLFSMLSYSPNVIYWVIGGGIADALETGVFKTKYFQSLKYIICEGNSMVRKMVKLGLSNAIAVPNFKNITYVPEKEYKFKQVVDFVFLSRIREEKGCNLIFQAVDRLNKEGFKEKFTVTFFGSVASEYKVNFENQLHLYSNVNYGGFLDLRNSKNYDELVKYDAMLFPTYWATEGFPGIIVDAYISALPVIASNWNLNADIIRDKETGLIIPPKSVLDLKEAMKFFIVSPSELRRMSYNSASMVSLFDINTVLSSDLLKQIGLCQ